MPIYENPSADKFKPPPPLSPPDGSPRRNGWSILLIVVTSYPVIHWLMSRRGSGWLAVAGPAAGVVLAILHYAAQRKQAEQRSGGAPYSTPTRITR